MDQRFENPRVLIAPDKFKGTLSASTVASIISQVVAERLPSAVITHTPIADGGDGSLDILLKNNFKSVRVSTFNALMEPVETQYGVKEENRKKLAFVEMANICGIASLHGRQLEPRFASSYGLGDVVYQVLTAGIDEIIVSLGGSASTDGGLGFLVGLGAIVKNDKGARVAPNLDGLRGASQIDLSLLHPRVHPSVSSVKWTFLVDVDNPLVGINGSAHVFGLQKGLRPEELDEADLLLSKWADLLQKASGIDVRYLPGTGAAGGVASVGRSIFSADFLSGSLWFADQLNLVQKITESDFVITGEGSFDTQSIHGKGPGLVVKAALEQNKVVGVVAGYIEPHIQGLESVNLCSLIDVAPSRRDAMRSPEEWLKIAAERMLEKLLATSKST